ncbi:hypothetical protein POM88_029797 [Heracleum sosnowskyi]|uniref:HTH myb-type domain-containing protein n=1 Tax=Heracleum sosnowskyi TaxID=360622 RepID=A0AAD8HVJ7_9APIA|nr:hypothetical protein POM88_029797 [Heracleum sosnowskyi]
MDSLVPPGFAPIQPGFGENYYENFHGQPHSAMNPAFEDQMYSVHETPGQGFGFQQAQVMDNAPLYRQGFSYQYSVQQQVMTYPVTQAATQGQPQQVQVERSAQEHVLIVELERPVLPASRPRLRWTPELHERFTRAAQELGGYFKATPKAILKKMNVRGLTRDQLKSHLQKVRNRVLHTESSGVLHTESFGVLQTESLEEIMGPGTQHNTNFSAPQILEGQHGRLLGSCEAPNHHSNHMIGPVEDPAKNFSFKDFDCPTTEGKTEIGLKMCGFFYNPKFVDPS